jgi:protein involved in polysaccharide export with SLBB domain
MTPDADMNYALLVHNNSGIISVVDLRLPASFEDEDSPWNQPLQPLDELHVFSKFGDRAQAIKPYLDLLNRQGTENDLVKVVSINGQIHHPGSYPFRDGMRVSDILRAGGDFNAGAYTLNAEITRNVIEHGRSMNLIHQNVDLAAILKGDASADIQLQPYDNLIIRQIPDWYEQVTVRLAGEVNFPGTYTVRKGETLTQLIKRAGGFTQHASLKGAVFTRESLRQNEQKEIDRLRDRMRSDLAATFVEKNVGKEGTEVAQYSVQLLDQLQSAKAVGRMAIDLPAIMNGSKNYLDIVLKDGDELYIPQPRQEVMVLGEVMYPTSHVFHVGMTYKDYINQSGGTAIHADTKRIYVIKANGMVQTTRSDSSWFRSSVRIEPGDSIIVPFDVEYISPLPMWRDVTQIIYNLAVSAAAVASF